MYIYYIYTEMKKYTLTKYIRILKNHTQRTTNINHKNKILVNKTIIRYYVLMILYEKQI